MKGKYTVLLTNLVLLVMGGTLVAYFNDERMAERIAIALGVLFLAPSLFSAIMLLFVHVPTEDARYNPRYNLIPVIGGMSFGVVIVLKAALFVGLLKYLFAVLLLVGGLYYVFYFIFARTNVVVPNWFYVLPGLVTCAGLVALVLPIEDNSMIFLISGVSMIALVFTSVFTAFAERAAAKARAEKDEAALNENVQTPAESDQEA